MLFRVLKKDLLKRKGVNIILFLFVVLSTVFLSSSVNNILVVGKAVDYFLEYANVPDANIIANGKEEQQKIEDWLDSQNKLVKKYGTGEFLTLQEKRILIKNGGELDKFNSEGNDVYVSDIDVTYNKVYDNEGKKISLKNGEFAMSGPLANKNKLKVGDRILVTVGGLERTLTLKEIMKDAAFGNEMMGMSRIVVNQSLFEEIKGQTKSISQFFIISDNAQLVNKKVSEQGFESLINVVTKDTYNLIYAFDMIMAALLILIGICLILIALLVLRFTLVFTMEEAYQEIGIMKAVGIRDFSIKRLYLVKYLFIVLLGALLGLAISFPVSSAMVAGVSENMIMESSSKNLLWNVICAAFVVLIVMLFCYGCTRRLKKISAIDAIRGGQTGERYVKRRGIRLYKQGHMSVPLFVGLNDILCHVKRYLLLIITFSISFVLITIPLNTLNTMESKEMTRRFLIDPNSSVYVKKIEAEDEEKYSNSQMFENGMKRLEEELQDKGYKADLSGAAIFFMEYSKDRKDDTNILTAQIVGPNNNFLEYEEGKAPVLSNEVAFSRQIMEMNDWVIGDRVKVTAGGEIHSLIITGSYTDYMQIGKSARLNPKFDCKDEWMFDYWNIMVDMKTDKDQADIAAELEKEFPDYEWSDAQTIIDRNVGGIKNSLENIKIPMTGMLCLIIMLITVLMEKLFIVREKGEIAMLKSIGFRNIHIKKWQIMRMICVVAIAMIVAVPLSLLSNRWVLTPIFAIMGASVKVQVIPWQVYGVYPAVLLLGIVFAVVIATRNVRTINIRELNNLE